MKLTRIDRAPLGCTTVSQLVCGCMDSPVLPNWQMTDVEDERYSTMDNIDGKQARRTGTSSGLGELFEYANTKISVFKWFLI
jgi:hypothetical protein